MGYRIYNQSPANVTIDKADEGNVNDLSSMYYAFT